MYTETSNIDMWMPASMFLFQILIFRNCLAAAISKNNSKLRLPISYSKFFVHKRSFIWKVNAQFNEKLLMQIPWKHLGHWVIGFCSVQEFLASWELRGAPAWVTTFQGIWRAVVCGLSASLLALPRWGLPPTTGDLPLLQSRPRCTHSSPIKERREQLAFLHVSRSACTLTERFPYQRTRACWAGEAKWGREGGDLTWGSSLMFLWSCAKMK